LEKRSILLSNSEFEYLSRKKQFSKSFEYKIKSQLKKKISIFLDNEFPLLLQSGLIDVNDLVLYINNISNTLPILGKEKVAGSNPAQGFLVR
jgi:hypothetical protein